MPRTLRIVRLAPLAALAGCGLFAGRTLPIAPDEAPVTEIAAVGRDTTYAVRATGYWLLTSHRAALWNRNPIDDAAWRWRSLFGAEPPMIAVRIDSGAPVGDSIGTWHGLLVVSAPPRPLVGSARGRSDTTFDGRADASLALAAARAWLRTTSREATRTGTGGPPARYPAWFEVATLATLSQPARGMRSDGDPTGRDAVSLASLFTVPLPEGWSVHDLARNSAPSERGVLARRARAAEPVPAPGVARITPRFSLQAVSVLAYLHDRDRSMIGALAAGLARGCGTAEILAASTTLPHDLAALDADWRRWARRQSRTGFARR